MKNTARGFLDRALQRTVLAVSAPLSVEPAGKEEEAMEPAVVENRLGTPARTPDSTMYRSSMCTVNMCARFGHGGGKHGP